MKTHTICLLTVISAALICSAQQTGTDNYLPPLPDGTQPGRFQLFGGDILDFGTGPRIPKVFRIDTATGRVWQFEQASIPITNGPGLLTQGWTEIPESYYSSVTNNQSLAKYLAGKVTQSK